jgi:hypothetical protein
MECRWRGTIASDRLQILPSMEFPLLHPHLEIRERTRCAKPPFSRSAGFARRRSLVARLEDIHRDKNPVSNGSIPAGNLRLFGDRDEKPVNYPCQRYGAGSSSQHSR